MARFLRKNCQGNDPDRNPHDTSLVPSVIECRDTEQLAAGTPVALLRPVISSVRDSHHALAEAAGLARALDMNVVHMASVRIRNPAADRLFGAGCCEEMRNRINRDKIKAVIVDGALTAAQQGLLETDWKVPVIGRTRLILDIFAKRASSREGVLQVELADLEYQRARLVRRWEHLERQRGATGFVGGAGETQIEADRRAIDLRISSVKRRLSKIVRTRALHREARRRVPYPIVALVGYTNCGKSTLFNRLTKSSTLTANMPFATLDPKLRSLHLPSGRTAILSDTVGFISDLPTELVAAFRATLEETVSADLILHVRDIAHAEVVLQEQIVKSTLRVLGIASHSPLLHVNNKIDLLNQNARSQTERMHEGVRIPEVSALSGEGIDCLIRSIDTALRPPETIERMLLSFDEGKCRSWLHRNKVVIGEQISSRGIDITVKWSRKQRGRFRKYNNIN